MICIKKILVPQDGSELAECVLSHMDGFVADCRVETIVSVRVVKPASFLSIAQNVDVESEPKEYENMMKNLDRIEEKRVALAAGYLEAVVNRTKQGDIEYNTEVPVGKISKSMVNYAESNEIDLILMATHGRSGSNLWLQGRTADRLLRFSKIPVLMVRPDGIVSGDTVAEDAR
jgi:nucleotide-binding universal stress UspA family protein